MINFGVTYWNDPEQGVVHAIEIGDDGYFCFQSASRAETLRMFRDWLGDTLGTVQAEYEDALKQR